MKLDEVEEMSQRVRELLWKHSPEIVSAAESFASEVVYIPISATGRSPEVDAATGALGIRPRDMNPMWAEVPLLYTMSRWLHGIVPFLRPKSRPTIPITEQTARPQKSAAPHRKESR